MCSDVYEEIKQLDRGTLTADFANDQTNTIVHVFNHYILDIDSADRTVRFIKGRILWLDRYLRVIQHVKKIKPIKEEARLAVNRRIVLLV